MFDRVALALLGGGLAFKSHKSRCFSIFLIKLQKAEQEVIQAAISTMEMGTKQERLGWFGKVPEAFKKTKIEQVEKIFFSQKLF